MINWPDRYSPQRARVHVRNEIAMDVKPEIVWAWIIRAKLWPTWYSNSARVAINGGGSDLQAGSTFRWKTFGITLNSKVEEFAPFERLAWSAKATGIDAYHAWLIEPTSDGCHVNTEETQNGWLAALNKATRPNDMSQKHQAWLEGLLAKARTGLPPPKPY
jgi:Polyketide cyclase / dehydrase and lipid transport